MPAALKIRSRAKHDMAQTVRGIAVHNVDASLRWLAAVEKEFLFLTENPHAGDIRRPAPKSLRGMRSWPVGGFRNYLIFYLPKRTRIEIVRVLHGAQDTGRI